MGFGVFCLARNPWALTQTYLKVPLIVGDINIGGLTASDSIFYVNFEPIRLKQSGYSVKKSCFENKLSDKTDFVVGGNCRAEFSILSAGQNLQ